MKYPRLLAVSLLLLVAGCEENKPTPLAPDPAPTFDEITVRNCEILRDALEAFAADNDGRFPGSEFLMLDYLPGREVPVNPYNGLSCLAIEGHPVPPGFVAWELFDDGSARWDPVLGYRLQAFGLAGPMVEFKNVEGVSQEVVDGHALLHEYTDVLVEALEAFHTEAGRYPDSLGDETPSGESVYDLLSVPAPWSNPFTGDSYSPQDGLGLPFGEIGYLPLTAQIGPPCAYIIETVGICDTYPTFVEDLGTLMAHQLTVMVVKAFAQTNGGVYPRDVDTDETPSGNTVLELLAPYEPIHWDDKFYWPVNGVASAVHEVGYVPVLEGENVIGCIINARGLTEEVARYESPIAPSQR